MTVLATLAVIVALWWGRSFMIPLTAGLMLSLLVLPLTAVFTRWLHSRIAATLLTLMIVMTALGLAASAFGDQLGRVAGRVPDMISLVAQQVSDTEPGADSVLQRARVAFRELDRAADRLAGAGTRPLIQTARAKAAAARQAEIAASNAAASTPPVSISQTATVVLREGAVSGSSALLKLASDLTIIFFIAFFVLAGGQPLADRVLGLWGERPGLKLRAEHAAFECMRQIRIYSVVLLVTNTVVGLVIWVAFSVVGLPDAGGWAVTAAVLHVVPYLGMALLTGLGAAETFLALGSVGAALGMAAFIVLMSTAIGTVVTAWLQGRAAHMNAAAVFIGVVFWGALWGVWGLLLGPALVVLLKVVAEHTRPGQRLAQLMQG
ncbi:MAG: AI-2E family transporter [Burkholderiaceae bacterium]